MGPTGKAVGVEHIPQLVDRSVQAIKRGNAAELLAGGQLLIIGDGFISYFLSCFDFFNISSSF